MSEKNNVIYHKEEIIKVLLQGFNNRAPVKENLFVYYKDAADQI